MFNFNQQSDEIKLNLKAIEKIDHEIKLLKSDIVSMKATNLRLSRLNKHENLVKPSTNLTTVAQNDQSQQSSEIDDNVLSDQQFNPIEMEKNQEEKQTKNLDKINNAFLAESLDQSWSPEATALIKGFFDTEAGAKINLVDYECRKTLCKVEITKPENSNLDDNVMMIFPMHISKALSQGSFFHQKNEDGSTNVIIYLVRNGFDLPA
jgi:hypothetical protein